MKKRKIEKIQKQEKRKIIQFQYQMHFYKKLNLLIYL